MQFDIRTDHVIWFSKCLLKKLEVLSKVQFSEELRNRMMKVDPAQMGHYISNGYMCPSIKPVYKSAKMVGPAVTVRITGDDNAMLYYAIEHAEPGSVVVVDRGGEAMRACCGDGVALVAQLHGMAGIVIDGMATDSIGIEKLNFPVFSKGISALTTTIQGKEGMLNIPVQCGGTIVNPGDIIFGDIDGVVVIPPQKCEELVTKAEEATTNEISMKKSFREGKTMSDFFPAINTMMDK
jgi:4-hydroxy-4-methyl-2-oxoglutarate aldolase